MSKRPSFPPNVQYVLCSRVSVNS